MGPSTPLSHHDLLCIHHRHTSCTLPLECPGQRGHVPVHRGQLRGAQHRQFHAAVQPGRLCRLHDQHAGHGPVLHRRPTGGQPDQCRYLSASHIVSVLGRRKQLPVGCSGGAPEPVSGHHQCTGRGDGVGHHHRRLAGQSGGPARSGQSAQRRVGHQFCGRGRQQQCLHWCRSRFSGARHLRGWQRWQQQRRDGGGGLLDHAGHARGQHPTLSEWALLLLAGLVGVAACTGALPARRSR
ncbi:IPTL-CTERM sorting domain-containing protein [Acidovorax sp. RAC01]|uniref:IPTL-CTERM sorting domain-containing protein n=1 Tax=Acidovorax sp. RAC01 TaxID=1842533 RepID=UPI003FA41B74